MPNSDQKRSKKQMKRDDKPFKCSFCDETYKFQKKLESHELKHTLRLYKCEQCPEQFDNKKTLYQHKRQAHRLWRCYICKVTFTKEKIYLLHIASLHEGRNHDLRQCKDCGKQFNSDANLKVHELTKCGTYCFYKCEECTKAFKSPGALHTHKSHHAEQKFACEECGRKFWTSGQLKVHMRSHTKEKVWFCEFCNKGFSHRETLVGHVSMHTGVKPYKCDNCDKFFSCISNLIKHRQSNASTCGKTPSRHQMRNLETKLRCMINTPKTIKVRTIEKQEALKSILTDIVDEFEIQEAIFVKPSIQKQTCKNNYEATDEVQTEMKNIAIKKSLKIKNSQRNRKAKRRKPTKKSRSRRDTKDRLQVKEANVDIQDQLQINKPSVDVDSDKCENHEELNTTIFNEDHAIKIGQSTVMNNCFVKLETLGQFSSNNIDLLNSWVDHKDSNTDFGDFDNFDFNLTAPTSPVISKLNDSTKSIKEEQCLNERVGKLFETPMFNLPENLAVENPSQTMKTEIKNETRSGIKEAKNDSTLTETRQPKVEMDSKKIRRKKYKTRKDKNDCACSRCGRYFKSNWALEQHLKRPDFCLRRNEPSTLNAEFYQKLSERMKMKPYMCRVCSELFNTRQERKSHLLERHKEKLYCQRCDKIFCTLKSRANHEKSIHLGVDPGKWYVCGKCGTKRRTKRALEDHEKNDCGKGKLFACDLCPKTFSTIYIRKYHLKCHFGEADFKCEYCDKAFKWNGQLTRHRRAHTGEKPYKCEFCPKEFSYASSLQTHNSLHTGIKPYVCKGCGTGFSCTGNLRSHLRSHADTCALSNELEEAANSMRPIGPHPNKIGLNLKEKRLHKTGITQG